MENAIKRTLVDLELADESTIVPYYPRVRDREDIGVLRDETSGVIFLDRSDHMDISHYEKVQGGTYWGAKDRKEALVKYREDDARRANQFATYIADRDFVDVGCGTGGLLDLVKDLAKSVSGVEPQAFMRTALQEEGLQMYRLANDLPPTRFDVAGLFHTLEHLTDPLGTLADVKKTLRPGGLLIIEVPHAKDALLAIESFRALTLWSEHLILHAHESLKKFLEIAGYKNIRIEGFQRYPLANHIGWLVEGAPSGQKKHADLLSDKCDIKYSQLLKDMDKTDTLIAFAEV